MGDSGRNFHNDAGVIDGIGQQLSKMTPTHKKIGTFVINNPENVVRMSISKLARESGARSESSVVRFYQFLGYSGYHDFKVSLATEIAGRTFYHTYEDIDENDGIGNIKTKLFTGSIKTLEQNMQTISDDSLRAAVDIIDGAGRLILLGYAVSAAVAYDAYFKFTRLGLNCHFSTDPHINAVLLSETQSGDVVLGISQSGETRDLVIPVEAVKSAVKVVGITGDGESSLARISDVCLTTTSEERNYRTDALISRIVQKVLISVLYTGVAIKRGSSIRDQLHESRRALSYLKF